MATDGRITRAVADALKDAPLLPRDGAAAALAREYARLLDGAVDADVIADVGPKLLATLSALGMTPAGRGSKGGAPGAPAVKSELDKARDRRAQRAG